MGLFILRKKKHVRRVNHMAKLGDITTPVGGGNIFKLQTWAGLILSVMAMFIAVAVGQKAVKKVEDVSRGKIDGTPDQLFAQKENINVKQKRVW
jgi:hypothetical protein